MQLPCKFAFRFFILAAVFSSLLSLCTLSANDKKAEQAEAQALLDRAATLTNIEAAGSQPFVLIANTSWIENGKTTNGRFGIAWQQMDRYREQIAFPGFMQTEVVSNGKLYRARNAGYLPLLAIHWLGMFPIWNAWESLPVSDPVRSIWTAGSRTNLKVDSGPAPKELASTANFTCVAGTRALPRDIVESTECFDNSTGLPLFFQQRWANNTLTYVFSDYTSVGEKRFPREITYADSAGERGEMKASRLSVFTTFADAEFQPEPNSKAETWCAEPTFVDQVKGKWPYDEARRWIMPRLPALDDPYLFVTVNAKGGVDKVFFDGFSPNSLQKSGADRVYGDQLPIKYCGKQAIPYEMVDRLWLRRPD